MDKERKQRTHHRGVRRLLATRQIDTQPAPDTSHFSGGYLPFSAPETSHLLLRIPPIFCSGYLPFSAPEASHFCSGPLRFSPARLFQIWRTRAGQISPARVRQIWQSRAGEMAYLCSRAGEASHLPASDVTATYKKGPPICSALIGQLGPARLWQIPPVRRRGPVDCLRTRL